MSDDKVRDEAELDGDERESDKRESDKREGDKREGDKREGDERECDGDECDGDECDGDECDGDARDEVLSDDEVSDDEVSDDEVSDDEVSDDEVSDDEVSDDEVSDDEVNDDEVNEALLIRFRDWLEQTRNETEALRGADEIAASGSPPAAVGLETLIEEFTALRQEVKLQTKSSRGLEEQTQSMLAGLQQAIVAFQSVSTQQDQAARAALKPLVTALAELDEALARGRKQTERAVERLRGPATSDLIEQLERLHASRGWWARRWNAAQHQRVLELVRAAGDRGSSGPLLDALVDGYRLVQRRLAQTMASVELVRIPTVGKLVDPETMVVVEVVEAAVDAVADGKRTRDGMVVDEVRCGYFWGDELLKCAEVRVARVREAATENDGCL